jgi:hypothetical protein
MGLPTFNEVWGSLPEGLRPGARRVVSKDGDRVAFVEVDFADVLDEEDALLALGAVLTDGVYRIPADPSVPYVPPKPPRPAPDALAAAARRIRSAASDEEAAALLALVLRGEGIA